MEKKTNNKVGLVFGHKPDDMAHAIGKMESLGFEPVVVTWPKYSELFLNIETHSQPTPENQGMDCINLFLLSKDLAFKSLKKRKIGAVSNNHTKPTLWDWDLTNEEWEKLFDFGKQMRYVDEIVEERYNLLFPKNLTPPVLMGGNGEPLYKSDGTKDSDEQDISGLTE